MLNKLKLAIIISLFSISLFAQDAFNKGVYTLSGEATYMNSSQTYDWTGSDQTVENTNISFTPSFGYFIINDLELRGNLTFLYNEFSIDNGSINTFLRRYSIGAGIKYYFRMSKISPFISADYSYSNVTTGNADGNRFTFAGGANYFLSRSVALEPFVQYSTESSINYIKEDNRTTFGIRIAYFIFD